MAQALPDGIPGDGTNLTSEAPKVTVLMSVYNGEKYLAEAVDSILNQTFRDFEFLIINDGSTDATADILERYQRSDNRITVYNQENQGLIASLNRGCQLARGEYVARMDADDVSLPERLAKQVQFMDTHPDIGVVGTWVEYMDENGRRLGEWHYPTAPGVIGWHLLFWCCLAHPSVVMRRDVFLQLGFYRPQALHAEDYDLWSRAVTVTRLANIPEVLLRYRITGEGICQRHHQTQEESVMRAMRPLLQSLLRSEVPLEVVTAMRKTSMGQPLSNLQEVVETTTAIRRLYRAYVAAACLSRTEASDIRHDLGTKLMFLALSAGKKSLRQGLSIYLQAVRLNPRLWPPALVLMGLSRVTRQAVGKLHTRINEPGR